MSQLLARLEVQPPTPGEAIDTGAEEELFRRIGLEAARWTMARHWEQSDVEAEPSCWEWGNRTEKLGRRTRSLRTLCGPVKIHRGVFYCPMCRQTEDPLDRQLGIDETGILRD